MGGLLFTKKGDFVDSGTVGEIDFQFMEEKNRKQRENSYYEFHNNLVYVVDENDPSESYEDWKKRNEDVVNVIPTLEDYVKVKHAFKVMDWWMWSLDDAKKFLTMSKEEYSQSKALTYAFIDLDGNWNQRGEMGWWGMDDPSKGTECYDAEWWQFVQNLPKNVELYVVDCHI